MGKIYKIHPAIGIARVGNSAQGFYLSPETAGGLPFEIVDGQPKPVTRFRDKARKLKRQAARFTIFEYDPATPNRPGRPVNLGRQGVVDIEWTVYLANKKAIWYRFEQLEGEHGYKPDHPLRNPQVTEPDQRKKLIIDPGPQTLRGPNGRAEFARGKGQPGYPQSFPPEGLTPFPITTLGEIRSDEAGRLLVLGGPGHSGTTEASPKITHYANNNNWFDDIADGPVSAVLVMKDGSRIQVDAPAWVIVAPPAFAPEIVNIITLYDVMYDLFVREWAYNEAIFRDGHWNEAYRPDFKTEIAPLLKRAQPNQWVARIPQFVHLFDFTALSNPDPKFNPWRQKVLDVIRPPGQPNRGHDPDNGNWLMPLLAGDNPITDVDVSKYLVLTQTQYFLLKQWAAGRFVNSQAEPEQPVSGQALDRAVLENCTGGAFCPGIEAGWIVRNKALYAEPFRLKHKKLPGPGLSLGENLKQGLEPGDISKRMALPWQADFNECSDQEIDEATIPWWPAQRPVRVPLDNFEEKQWTRGFAQNKGDQKAGDLQMVTDWKELGFIINRGTPEAPDFVEVERNSQEIKDRDR